MVNIKDELLKIIMTLPIERSKRLEIVELIEAEKEVAWSEGYEAAVDMVDSEIK